MKLLSIQQAAAQGIDRLRMPRWAIPEDHIKIDIRDGRHGPWMYFYSPFNKECNGRDPVDILILEQHASIEGLVPYNGPLPDSDEYREAVARFDGCLGEQA